MQRTLIRRVIISSLFFLVAICPLDVGAAKTQNSEALSQQDENEAVIEQIAEAITESGISNCELLRIFINVSKTVKADFYPTDGSWAAGYGHGYVTGLEYAYSVACGEPVSVTPDKPRVKKKRRK